MYVLQLTKSEAIPHKKKKKRIDLFTSRGKWAIERLNWLHCFLDRVTKRIQISCYVSRLICYGIIFIVWEFLFQFKIKHRKRESPSGKLIISEYSLSRKFCSHESVCYNGNFFVISGGQWFFRKDIDAPLVGLGLYSHWTWTHTEKCAQNELHVKCELSVWL